MNNKYLSNKILIELLKQYGVKKLVLSSGCRNIPFVSSVENDDDFECFSVIDERNAAFFGLGLSQESQEPVAIACTSGTAASNYVTGVTEAYYSHAPLVVLTFDRSPYAYKQLETQKIDQESIFESITKKSVTLPVIKDNDDIWYCKRIINEALIQMKQHGTGPIHINIPLLGDVNNLYNDVVEKKQIETINKINYIEKTNENEWNKTIDKLNKTDKILLVIGQRSFVSEEEKNLIKDFCNKTNCVVLADNLANFKCDNLILAGPIIKALNSKTIEKLLPDLIISFGDNMQERIKELLRGKNIEHWSIDETGEIRDCFKMLSSIYECSPKYFFKKVNDKLEKNTNSKYLENWKKVNNVIILPDMPFTNFYVVKQLANHIPNNSLLHLSILNATRQFQFFNLDESIKTFSNVNAFGIDGCLPTFMGQAYCTDNLAFIVIGDLSFFYAMNALAIRHVKNNVRVLMINNGGGAEFHIQPDSNSIPTIDKHIGAAHNRKAKEWAISLGYEYLSANDTESLEENMKKFVSSNSDKPIFFEVFTNMKLDGEFCLSVYREMEKCIMPVLEEL